MRAGTPRRAFLSHCRQRNERGVSRLVDDEGGGEAAPKADASDATATSRTRPPTM